MNNFCKKLICIILTLVFIFSLVSCGNSDSGDSYYDDTYYDDYESDEEALAEEASGTDYKSIYREFLTTFLNEELPENNGYYDWTFGLFCVDSDDIPELFVSESLNHGSPVEIYTIVGNDVKSVGRYGTFGACQFGEGNGIIRSYSAYFGEMLYVYYKLENGTATFLWGGYDQEPLDENSGVSAEYCIYETDPRDEDTAEIYSMTDKATFEAELEKYEAMITVDTTNNSKMFSLTQENIDRCLGSDSAAYDDDEAYINYTYNVEKLSDYGDCSFEKITFSGTYPGISKINESVNEKYTEFCAGLNGEEGYNTYAENAEENGQDISEFNYIWSVKNVWYSDKYVSIEYELEEYAGGAHGSDVIYGSTYDLNTGEKLNLSEISLSDGQNNIRSLAKEYVGYYFNKIEDEKAKQGMETEEDENVRKIALETVGGDKLDDITFFVDDAGLHIFFNQYEIASYAYGTTDIIIPLDEFDLYA